MFRTIHINHSLWLKCQSCCLWALMIFEARYFYLKPCLLFSPHFIKPATYHLWPKLARIPNLMRGIQMMNKRFKYKLRNSNVMNARLNNVITLIDVWCTPFLLSTSYSRPFLFKTNYSTYKLIIYFHWFL